MTTGNFLNKILEIKQAEVDRLIRAVEDHPEHPVNRVLGCPHPLNSRFSAALIKKPLAVIAEVKRRSPSRGQIHEISNPVELSLKYCQGGAAAISVLTDFDNFGGSLNDLSAVSKELSKQYPEVAVLRKDFIIHPLQLAEAASAGAHAALLIVSVLGSRLKSFIDEAARLGIETLTEVHDLPELELAIAANAPIIGINHRNLSTFEFDMSVSERLRPQFPPHVISVAESGIHEPMQANKMRRLGFNAILVGEALVRSKDPSKLIREMMGGTDES